MAMAFAGGRLCLIAGSLILHAWQRTGSVKIDLIDGRPVVDGVYVNGHGPYRFLVDTATTSNHMESALAKSIGLTPTYRTELLA